MTVSIKYFKQYEQIHSEIDPYSEENWEDDNVLNRYNLNDWIERQAEIIVGQIPAGENRNERWIKEIAEPIANQIPEDLTRWRLNMVCFAIDRLLANRIIQRPFQNFRFRKDTWYGTKLLIINDRICAIPFYSHLFGPADIYADDTLSCPRCNKRSDYGIHLGDAYRCGNCGLKMRLYGNSVQVWDEEDENLNERVNG